MAAMAAPPELITQRLRTHAQRTPQRLAYTFLRDDGKIDEITYHELDLRARTLAATLAQRAPSGARALLLYPAGLEFITVYFACLFAGIMAVPATIPHKTRASRRLRALIEDADPALILTRSDCEPAIKASLSLVDAANRECLSTDTLAPAGDPSALPELRADMTAFLQYTSGSTSMPKGVAITHQNIMSNVEAIRQAFQLHPDSVTVHWLPLFHDMGLIGSVVTPVHVGFHSVLMAPATFLKNPVLWLEAISHYRGTCAGAPNFGWDYCARKISDEQKERLDLSSLEVAYNGSEPVRAATLRSFVQAFERCGVRASAMFPCYGMAETTLFIAGGPASTAPQIHTVSKSLLEGNQIRDGIPGSDDAREIVSSGRVADSMKVLIVDPETCLPVSGHRVGEVWIAGDSVARGYWNKPVETQAIFGAHLASDGQGPFLRTGDLAFMRDGELFITGRLKDLIIINGRNVYPQDVEEVIERAIDFIEPNMCAAFSVEIEFQERLAIVAEANRSLVRAAQQELRENASKADQLRVKDDYLSRIEAVAHNICNVIAQQFDVSVSSIVFVKPGSFPRTTSGKVQRARCKEMALQGQLEVVYVMPGSIFDRRGSRDAPPAAAAPALPAPAPAPAAPDPLAPEQSRASADAMIAWFRQYAARRLNSHLIDERRTIPPYVVLDLGNQGFFGLQVPKRFGGRALAAADAMRVLEQLAAVDLTLATMVGVHNGLGVRPILQFGSAAMRERLLPALAAGRQLAAFALTEPDAGSNPLAMRATAVKAAGGWRVSAEKQWIGLASWAGVLTVFAKAVDASGAPLGSIALVIPEDCPGLAQGPEAPTMGMRGMVQNTVYLDAAFVPDGSVLLLPGDGMVVGRDAMMFSRLGIGAMCVGAMKRCAQLMARYAARREIATGRLADNPVTVARLQDLACAIFAVEALVYAIADGIDRADTVPVEAYLACKTAASELLGQSADSLVQLLGGRGYVESNIAPRIVRDARVLRILEGPSETLYMHLGAAVTQPANAASGFIASTLGRPALGAELATAVAQLKAAANQGTPLFAGDAALTQWLDYRLGELAAAAVVLGAAESRQANAGGEAGANAVAWARRRFSGLRQDILGQLESQASYATSASLLRQIDGYAEAIGDVEQRLPGERHELDPALRHALAAPPPAPAEAQRPSVARSAPGQDCAAAPSATQLIVHDCVLAWLRGETRREVEAIDFDTPFTALGMDSLASVSIAVEIEQHVEMPIIPELLYDYQTINALAAYIDARRVREAAGQDAAQAEPALARAEPCASAAASTTRKQ
jgi:acyl-CoA synthetase (AMP-forming)/AMP-acid ligase II/alkylation response protein AidB-like acyl-CoA dehydrogenase/acyl carrier protein